MANTTTKIVAVVVVVIVVIVVAAAAVILLSNDDKDPGNPGDVGTSAIYGNVNGDFYIDDKDVEVIQDIIDGKREASDWPLADANLDGVVDEEDLDIVKKASKGESTTLYVVDCTGNMVAVSYPVTDYAAVAGTNSRAIIAVLGLADGMLANASSNISEVLDKELYEGKQSGEIYNLSDSSAKLSAEDVVVLANLGVKIVLAEDNSMTTEEDVVAYLEGAGIVYLPLNYEETDDVLDACKCLGILFGCEKKAQDYCEWNNSIMDTIVDKEGDQFGTATCLCAVMANYVSGTSSDYYAATQKVGGNNIADWDGSTQKFNVGDTWLYDHKYDADYFFHFRTTTFPTVEESYFDTDRSYFGETYTFQNGGFYLINGAIPLPIRNALIAEIMYPDCFDSDWSDQLFEYYFTHFLGQEWENYEYYWNVTATSP